PRPDRAGGADAGRAKPDSARIWPGHVAGGDEDVGVSRREEGRMEARQRARAREAVGDRLDAEAAEALRAVGRHQDLREEFVEQPDGSYRDRLAGHRSERFVVSAHAHGAAAGDDHPRDRRAHAGAKYRPARSCQLRPRGGSTLAARRTDTGRAADRGAPPWLTRTAGGARV